MTETPRCECGKTATIAHINGSFCCDDCDPGRGEYQDRFLKYLLKAAVAPIRVYYTNECDRKAGE